MRHNKQKNIITKTIIIQVMVVIVLVFMGVLLGGFLHDSNHKKLAPTISTENWKTYNGIKTGIVFRYPLTVDVDVADRGNKSAGRAEVDIESVTGYFISTGKNDVDYIYQHATETDKQSANLELSIRLSDNIPISEHSFDLRKVDSVLVKTSSEYKYVVTREKTASRLAQCSIKDNVCRYYVDFKNRYIAASISAVEGWRYGGANLDYDSDDYQTLFNIISTLNI